MDDRALVELGTGACPERGRVRLRVDSRDLGAVDHEYREAVHRRAVRMPRVDVAVHGRGDDLEVAAVPVQVGQHR
jgi:hypothetical protein